MYRFKIIFLVLACLFLSDCGVFEHGLRGVPRAIGDEYIKQRASLYATDKFREKYDQFHLENNAKERMAERNKILNELILLTDSHYRDYEDFLYVGKGTTDTLLVLPANEYRKLK